MKRLLCLFTALALFACSKDENTAATENELVKLSAAVGVDTVVTSMGTFKYWKAIAILDRMVIDTCYVVVQWDAYSAPGNYETTMRDTVPVMPHQVGSVSHRSGNVYMNPWFAKEVKVVYAWSKNKLHYFSF
ncbi:MAG TPA: hypothetical protein VF145_10400 [Chitinophagaceae bacterium]